MIDTIIVAKLLVFTVGCVSDNVTELILKKKNNVGKFLALSCVGLMSLFP